MTPTALITRCAVAGFRVELHDGAPRLVPDSPGAELPPDLLPDLKAHRSALVRWLTVEAVVARARESKRAVFGRATGSPRWEPWCGIARDEWDWITVEGDEHATALPRAEPS